MPQFIGTRSITLNCYIKFILKAVILMGKMALVGLLLRILKRFLKYMNKIFELHRSRKSQSVHSVIYGIPETESIKSSVQMKFWTFF